VKTAIIALSAAALIAATPAGLAQSGKTPGPQHKVSKKHQPDVAGSASLHAMRAKGSAKAYPRTFGYESEPAGLDRETEMSRKAGGGGGM
jgi:hypothetical protein